MRDTQTASPGGVRIERGGLQRPEVIALLEEHLAQMRSLSPPGSVHALDLDGLRRPDITFWTAWDPSGLLGCAALKELSPEHGEIKSMRTPARRRGLGIGRRLLEHVVATARARGYRRLSLETGAAPAFHAAQTLYARHGFVACAPFASYAEDPHSVFMTLAL